MVYVHACKLGQLQSQPSSTQTGPTSNDHLSTFVAPIGFHAGVLVDGLARACPSERGYHPLASTCWEDRSVSPVLPPQYTVRVAA
jgi:hypothetical protein